jgi:hypothetical protein
MRWSTRQYRGRWAANPTARRLKKRAQMTTDLDDFSVTAQQWLIVRLPAFEGPQIARVEMLHQSRIINVVFVPARIRFIAQNQAASGAGQKTRGQVYASRDCLESAGFRVTEPHAGHCRCFGTASWLQ